MVGVHGARFVERDRTGCRTAVAVVLLAAIGLPAQRPQGHLGVRVFAPSDYRGGAQVWSVTQGPRGDIYVGTNSGISRYDGSAWETLPHPEGLRCTAVGVDTDGMVLFGCGGDFGYLADRDHRPRFVSVRDRLAEEHRDVRSVLRIVPSPRGVFFASAQAVYRWDREADTVEVCELPGPAVSPRGMNWVAGRCLLPVADAGLTGWDGDRFVVLPGGDRLVGQYITGYVDTGDGGLLVCASREGMHRFDGESVTPIESPAQDLLREARIQACVPLSGDRHAVSTISGGVVVIDGSGEIVRVLDRDAGLPSNSVNGACWVDRTRGLWIPTDFGLARVQFGVEERWGYDLGLDGAVTQIAEHAGRIFVATSVGLFVVGSPDSPGRASRCQRVEPVKGRVFAMASVARGLLVGTDRGLVLLDGDEARSLMPEAVTALTPSMRGQRVHVGTWSSGLMALEWDGQGQPVVRVVWPGDRPLIGVIEDGPRRLWVARRTSELGGGLVRLEVADDPSGAPDVVEYETGSVPGEDLRVFPWQDTIHVLTRDGVRSYDPVRDVFAPDLLEGDVAAGLHGALAPTADPDGGLWFVAGDRRIARLSAQTGAVEFPVGHRHDRLHSVLFADSAGSLWGGGIDGRLVRYPDRPLDLDACEVRLNRVQSSHGLDLLGAVDSGDLALDHAHRSLRFEFSVPCHFDGGGHSFQWRLVGQDDTWSEWTAIGHREFADLREGAYRFEVRSRHGSGPGGAVRSLAFELRPPWYRSWLFLASLIVTAGLGGFGLLRRRSNRVRARLRTMHASEQALRASELRYRTLMENAPEAILVYDTEVGRFVEVNEGAVKMFGYSRRRLLAMGPLDLSAEQQENEGESSTAIRRVVQQALRGEKPSFEWLHHDVDGREFPAEVRLVGQPAPFEHQIRATVIDVSERHRVDAERERLEEQLRTARKLEALGRLAGGIAHDFNNILTGIHGETDLLRLELSSGSPAEVDEHLEVIEQCTKRAAGLTGQLLAFSRQQVVNPCVVDLRDMLTSMEPMLRRVIREDIETTITFADARPWVRVGLAQIEQTVINLVANARDAMPDGGSLQIVVSRQDLDPAYVARHPDATAGSHVVLAVRDTGGGVDPADLPHLFEPFFTTKDAGRGTGLGLPTVYGIVRQAGGHVDVQTELGVGTTVRVLLPFSNEAPESEESEAEKSPRGTETVLVCDDDATVLRTTAAILGRHGYTVLRAEGPQDAREHAESLGPEIDLLLTDVVMPGTDGRELADELSARCPQMATLFMSGYTADVVLRRGVDGRADLVEKPFTSEVLLHRVRDVLSRKRPDAAARRQGTAL